MSVAKLPWLSVVMPVHNALPHLDAAVESILGQTFRDFSFIILDDASTDGSSNVLRKWAKRDSRIRLLEAPEQLGPALSSQHVAMAATTPIVARMDADDLSHPERLERQMEVFDRCPEVGVVACLCDFIDIKGRIVRRSQRWRLASTSPVVPFAHGSMMYRREIFRKAGGYRGEAAYWEDQDIVTRMAAMAPVMVIPRSLYRYRFSQTSTRLSSDQQEVEQAVDLMYRSRARVADNQPYDDLLALPRDAHAKLDPRVFISLGSVELWAGMRPRMFKRLLSRGDLRPNFRTAAAFIWTAWASLEPTSLRLFIRMLLLARNLRAAMFLRSRDPVEWASHKTSDAKAAVGPIDGQTRAPHATGAVPRKRVETFAK